jgi:16S rRNA (adenine1518-N6/adenine1519-N6)-dimethyltransferase
VQREVAERIMGRQRTGKGGGGKTIPRMSLLAVGVQFYGVPRLVGRIPAGAFRPTPAVDSAVVRVDTYECLPWHVADEKGFFRVVRAGFAAPRKQLRNNLAHGLPVEVDEVVAALERAGVDYRRRAETVSIEEWVRVSNELLPALDENALEP